MQTPLTSRAPYLAKVAAIFATVMIVSTQFAAAQWAGRLFDRRYLEPDQPSNGLSLVPISGGGSTIQPSPISPGGDGDTTQPLPPVSGGGGGVTPDSAAADLFWRTDGTGGNWAGVGNINWSNPASATGGTVWASGDDAFFTANSTVTYVTGTLFADVTVDPSITVTVTADGTASAGAHVYDIGAGSTLNWASQGFTAAGTSFVKNGDGIWNMGAISNAYTGGFTLNAGKVIVSGDNSLGGSASPLTINGGTIQSSGTRAFAPTAITIGGDFILTGTGASTWGGTVDLGAATRTITNSAVGSGVTRTFSGVISGSGAGVGLTIVGTGTGTAATTSTTILSGANTYSGGTTLNTGGILQLSGSGTLGSTSGSLTVNAGRVDLNGTTQSVGNLTGSGGTILNNATGTNITFTIGTGNNGGGNYQGVIANNTAGTGTVALTKTGTGTITLSGANTYTGTTTINAGTLEANATGGNKALGGTTNIVVNTGGTLLTSSAQQFNSGTPPTISLSGGKFNAGGTSQTLGALTLTASSTIDFGSGASILSFGGTSTRSAGTLTIDNWSGDKNLGGGTDQLLFANTLPQAFLDNINFTGYSPGAVQFGGGEVVPVPESSTWIGGALAVGVVAWTQRRRFARLAAIKSRLVIG